MDFNLILIGNMRICSKCNLEKDENCFSKGGRGYLKSQCKDCNKQYRLDHKTEQQEYDKQYYQDNKKPIYEANKSLFKEKNAKYYQENKEVLLEKRKMYYIDNLPVIKDRAHQYRLTHKGARNKHSKDRYDNDPVFKLRVLVSTAVGKFLKNVGSSKDGKSSSKYLPYTIQELKDHIEKQFESWMTWSNQGKYDPKIWNDNDQTTWVWQIDHIIPQSKLIYTSLDEDNFQKAWALDNLRSLSAKQNIMDRNRR